MLTGTNVDDYGTALAAWKPYLTQGADVLLWGCDVGADARGVAFLDKIATFTGADVAASSNATGAAALGGDWILERSTGSIEAHNPIAASELARYDALLPGTAAPVITAPTTTLSIVEDGGAITLTAPI